MRRKQPIKKSSRAQAAFEYLLLLGATAVVVLLAFNTMLPKQRLAAEGYYNATARGILGRPANYVDNGVTIDRARTLSADYP